MFRSIIFLFLVSSFYIKAQSESEILNPDSIPYKILIDNPENVRRLYLGIQPIYADAFVNNVNAGFGTDAFYLPKSGKFDLRVSFRKPYSSRFFDQSEDRMSMVSSTLNRPVRFMFLEIGGSMTVKDLLKTVPSKIAVIRKTENPSSMNWVEAVPIIIPSQLRVLQAVRAGFQSWRSSVDVTKVLDRQGSRNADVALPEELTDADGNVTPFYVFSNLYNRTVFAGYGITRIKNQSILIDQFETAVKDKIITWYADLMFAPSLSLDDAVFGLSSYSLDKVNLRKVGLRAGTELRANRATGFGFGAELGWRPGPKKNAGYLMMRLSIPVFAGYMVNRD